MDVRNDFDLRYRHPMVHQLSYDSEVKFLVARPEVTVNENVADRGSYVADRSDQEYFCEKFLERYENNLFTKVPISYFSRSIVR